MFHTARGQTLSINPKNAYSHFVAKFSKDSHDICFYLALPFEVNELQHILPYLLNDLVIKWLIIDVDTCMQREATHYLYRQVFIIPVADIKIVCT